MATYLALGVTAIVIIAVFVDSDRTEADKEKKSLKEILLSSVQSFKQLRSIRQILILPLCFSHGLQNGFLGSDLARAYVSCSQGIWYIGKVMMAYGGSAFVSGFGL